ncbi:shieldin complex subunit 1-like [Scyliorhinus canicula]|uniref:shieldin complex subunit 1-like n=1 Tax=Scyliorhinus canicula TaxID=7830 RepID=UPI0018F2D831|nr:shieldin complex subunit 1-like [Scyliorhinus canicula]
MSSRTSRQQHTKNKLNSGTKQYKDLLRIMSSNEVLSSNHSESNSVLELPATYSLPREGGQLMFDEVNAIYSLDGTANISSSVMSTVNIDSDRPNSESGISSFEAAELHSSNEDEHGRINITQTMEEFFKDTEQRKLLESNPVSEQIAHLLTSKISQLKKGGSQYLLRSFQMALVLFNRHGAIIFKKETIKGEHFSSVNSAANAAELNPLPGLSNDVVSFILQEISK